MRYARIVLILLLFWGAVLRYMTLIPPFEGSDEREHLGYVTQLRGGTFPDPRTSLQNLAVQASGQAPLHYLLTVLWSRLAPDYTWDGELPDNLWRSYVRPLPGHDNPNYTLFGPDHIPYEPNPNIGVSVLWQRFVSAFEGMLAVALAYSTACLLLPTRWALFVTLMVAFNSVLVQIFALLTNDAAAILFGFFCTYRLAALLKRPVTLRGLLLTGVVIGLGTLTKLSVLVFVPVAGVVVLLRAYDAAPRPLAWGRLARQVVGQGLWLALPVLVIGGPWYLYHGIVYGDPLGIEPHLRMNWAHIPPRSLALALAQDGFTPLLTLWSGYAWGLVTTGGWVYAANLLLLAAGLFGFGRAFRRLWQTQRFVIITLALAWAGVFIAYLRWWTMFTFMNGRHLLPGYLALMILAALGLSYGWNARAGRTIRVIFGSLTVFIAWVIVGQVTLVEAFTTITFPPEQVPALQGTPLQFGEVKFLGYRLNPPALSAGEPIQATICWQSLRQDGRLAVPYGFAFHLVADETIHAGRESYPGMGKYTYWQPNRAFCDRFDLNLRPEQPIEPGRGYQIAVSLFDPQTGASLPDDAGVGPFVGWVGAHGPALAAAAHANALFDFDGALLLESRLGGTPTGVQVDLAWGTAAWRARPVTLFIHVTDRQGALVGQHDTPLGGTVYPAFLWGENENTLQTRYLIDTPPGEYTVYMGLYTPEDFTRLPVLGGRGQSAPDGRAILGVVQSP